MQGGLIDIVSRRRPGAIAFALAVLVAVMLLFVSESSYRHSRETLLRADEAQLVRLEVQRLLMQLSDAQSGQRGYLLTARPEHLETYRNASESIGSTLARLKAFVDARTDGRGPMAALEAVVERKLSSLDAVRRLHDEGRHEAALELLQPDVDKEQADAVRSAAEQLLAQEDRHAVIAREQLERTLTLAWSGVVAMVAVSLLALLMVLRQTRALDALCRKQHLAAQAEHEQLEREVARRTAQLTELARHLQSAREDERQHLARELHDELGALLTAAKLDAARIKSRLAAGSPEAIERLAHLNKTLDNGIALKRRIIEDLRPSSLSNLGLVAALEILLREFEARSGILVESNLQPVRLRPESELTVFRIVQEALANAAKHARAERVEVNLLGTDSLVTVEVSDDGAGFDPRALAVSADGLLGMRYRVEGDGGTLTVSSAPARGTRIAVNLPARSA